MISHTYYLEKPGCCSQIIYSDSHNSLRVSSVITFVFQMRKLRLRSFPAQEAEGAKV